jgi:probable phosphoglycerate mutase
VSIYIVRHGETAGNAGGVIQVPETPLNERGLAQAEAVGRRLSAEPIDRVIASDYARAHTTAQAIGRALGLEVEVHAGLRERNFGDLRGRPRSEIGETMYSPELVPPNGESWDVFHDRVERCWADVAAAAASTERSIAVVTHGLVCYSLALRLLGLPEGTEVVRGFGNTAVTVVDKAPPHRVSVYNCTAHLDLDIAARGSIT